MINLKTGDQSKHSYDKSINGAIYSEQRGAVYVWGSGFVDLVSIETGEPLATGFKTEESVTRFKLAPSGNQALIVTSGTREGVKRAFIVDTTSSSWSAAEISHVGGVAGAKYVGSDFVLSWGENQTAKLWNRTGALVRTFAWTSKIEGADAANQGELFLLWDHSTISMFSRHFSQPLATYRVKHGSLSKVRFGKLADRILAEDRLGECYVWELPRNSQSWTDVERKTQHRLAAELNADGDYRAVPFKEWIRSTVREADSD